MGMVLLDIGFEGPVLTRPETRRRAGISKRDDVVVDKVFAVAGGVGVKLAFRDLLAVMPGYRHFLPMKVKVGSFDDSLPDGEELASCRIIFRLQKDQGRAVFADSGRLFAEIAPADVGTLLWVVPI